MINKIITSEGNVQFIYGDSGKIINVHPFHVYTVFNVDTVSFLLIAMPKDSGLAIFTTKAEDLEINGETYTFEELPNALSEAFAIAGAQARAEIVDELPETGMTNTIYLVPKEDGHGYDEYIYIKETGTWELIGDTDIELSRYVKKTDFNAYTAQTAAKIDYLSGATDAEVAAREAADSFISGAVDTLSTALANEVQRAQNVESGLSDAIDAEETRALAAEDALDDKIDAVSGDVETETDRAEGVENAISGALDTHIADEVRHITAAERTSWDEKTKTISLTQAEYDALPSSAKTDATKLYVISDALPIDLSVYAKVSALTEEISARSAADTALDNKISVVSGNVETEATRAEGVENVLSGAIDAIDAKFIDDAKYEDSGNTKVINFYNGNTIKATIDCSDFIVDGMVDDVRIENGYLVIDFNTESGKQDIQIPLTDIFNPSNYYTKSETSGATEIANALALKLDASAYTVDSSVIENSVNPVQGGALYDELRIEGEPSETTLEWDNHDGGETTNYPNGVSTIKIEVVDDSESDGNGYSFFDENYDQLGYITVLYNDGDVTVDNYANVTYSISGNVVTVNYPTIAANVTVIGSGYDNVYTIKAIGESSVISVKDQVTANTASISGKANSSDVYLKSETSGATEISTALNAKLDTTAYTPTDLSNYYQKSETSGATEIATALNAKLDTTAYTPVDLSNYYQKSETSGKTEISTALSNKQDTLVSAQNIKTINNESILGSGNITIQGGGGEASSAITSGDTNAVAGGAVFDAVVYSASTYTTELTFDANGYAENWVVGTSAITIDVSGYTSDTRADYHFEDSNGLDLGYANIYKSISTWWSSWNNDADNCTITTDGDTATTATITDIPSDTVKIRKIYESNPPKAIISGDTPETWIKDALDDHRDNTTIHITAAERTSWNNKSNFSGSYNDLTDKPIPDSALTSYSTNAVQSKTLYDELRINNGGGETETTLTFEGEYSTNYPEGCTKIKVEVVGSYNFTSIAFYNDVLNLGSVNINNYSSISVNISGLQDAASYEISGTTVIISYPTVTNVTKIQVSGNGNYVYKAVTTGAPTALKNQVAANTTALGGLSLIKLSQQEYDALAPNYDNNTLYVII